MPSNVSVNIGSSHLSLLTGLVVTLPTLARTWMALPPRVAAVLKLARPFLVVTALPAFFHFEPALTCSSTLVPLRAGFTLTLTAALAEFGLAVPLPYWLICGSTEIETRVLAFLACAFVARDEAEGCVSELACEARSREAGISNAAMLPTMSRRPDMSESCSGVG